MSSLRSILSVGFVLFAGAFVFQACGKQSEGERCETLNVNEDCENDLECKDGICCPRGGSGTAGCGTTTATPVTDAAPDTNPTETAADTGGTDTAADTGGADAAVDTGAADAAEAG